MNKKPLLILSSLLLIPSVYALFNPSQLPSLVNSTIINWFGGSVATPTLLAYLRVGFFFTLFVIFFEALSHTGFFRARRNSAIVIALSLAAIGGLFAGGQLYTLFLVTYSSVIWFVILSLPVIAILAINFFVIPNTNRFFIALRLVLLLLLYYILVLMADSSLIQGLFMLIPFIPHGNKIKKSLLILPVSLLIFVQTVFAQSAPISAATTAIEVFAEWAAWFVLILIVITVIQLIRGGSEDQKKKSESTSDDDRTIFEKIVDFRKKMDSLGPSISALVTGTKKTEEDIAQIVAAGANETQIMAGLDKIRTKFKDHGSDKEGTKILLAQAVNAVKSIESSAAKHSSDFAKAKKDHANLADSLKSIKKELEDIETKVNGIKAKAKQTKKQKELADLEAILPVIEKNLRDFNKAIENEEKAFGVLDAGFAEAANKYLTALQEGEYRLAAHNLAEMKVAKRKGNAYTTNLKTVSVALTRSATELSKRHAAVLHSL